MNTLPIYLNHGQADIAREWLQAAGKTENSPDIGSVKLVGVEVAMTVPTSSIRAGMPRQWFMAASNIGVVDQI